MAAIRQPAAPEPRRTVTAETEARQGLGPQRGGLGLALQGAG
jgi:hypothetical protein